MEPDRGLNAPAPPVTRQWEGFGGVPICGDCWGSPDAPLVLLLHGGGQTRHAWKETGERLALQGFHAVALDARGHGASGWAPDGDYSPGTMAGDVAAVVRQIAPPRTALVGASMGGGMSLNATEAWPELFEAVVLVDIVPRMEADGVKAIWAFLDRNRDGFDTLEEVHEAVVSYQPHRKRKRNLEGLKKNLRMSEDGRLYWHWDPKWREGITDIDAYAAKLERAAVSLRIPVLLLRGVHSNVLSQDGVDAFLRVCPHAEYVNVKEASHMIAGDRNDVFADAVLDFLGRAFSKTDGPDTPAPSK